MRQAVGVDVGDEVGVDQVVQLRFDVVLGRRLGRSYLGQAAGDLVPALTTRSSSSTAR